MGPRRLSQLWSHPTGWVTPGLGQSERQWVWGSPQAAPSAPSWLPCLTLFSVGAGGLGHTALEERSQPTWPSSLVGHSLHSGGLLRHCSTLWAHQISELILFDGEETEAQPKDELALRSPMMRQRGSRNMAGLELLCSGPSAPPQALAMAVLPIPSAEPRFNWAHLQPQALPTPPSKENSMLGLITPLACVIILMRMRAGPRGPFDERAGW